MRRTGDCPKLLLTVLCAFGRSKAQPRQGPEIHNVCCRWERHPTCLQSCIYAESDEAKTHTGVMFEIGAPQLRGRLNQLYQVRRLLAMPHAASACRLLLSPAAAQLTTALAACAGHPDTVHLCRSGDGCLVRLTWALLYMCMPYAFHVIQSCACWE